MRINIPRRLCLLNEYISNGIVKHTGISQWYKKNHVDLLMINQQDASHQNHAKYKITVKISTMISIPGIGSAIERPRYIVTSSPISWAHIHNDSWAWFLLFAKSFHTSILNHYKWDPGVTPYVNLNQNIFSRLKMLWKMCSVSGYVVTIRYATFTPYCWKRSSISREQ